MRKKKTMQIVLWLLLSVPFISLKAQQSLWVGEEYQCFLTDYANTSLSIVNVSWTVPSEMKEEFSGTYVRTVSFEEYHNDTYNVRASWKETDLSDSFSPFYSKSHTWSFTCRDNPLVLNNSSLTLTKGSTGTIGYSHTYSNEYTSLAKVTYSSSNSSVASVSSTGVVTAKGTGTATITVTSTIAKDPKTCTVTVKNSSTPDPDPNPGPVVPTGISLPASQSVQVGSTITLTPTITPSNASTTLTWDSSDKTVATVSSGKVSGKSVGTTTITVKTSNNKTASCTVTVTPVEPTGISLPESMTVAVGDFISVTPTITPSDAETTFTWSSNDKSIAIAYANGMIEGVKVGTTRIKVVTANNLVAWSTVYVKPAPESIALASESINLLEGDTIKLTPTFIPSDAVSTLTWRSEDESIATVTSEGVVEGVKAGTTRIWVETSNWLSASCTVIVTPSPIIQFADAAVKALCVANWDTNGDGELSEAEAAAVTDLGKVFTSRLIKSFNELQYFTGLTSIGDYAFSGCSFLTSITIPESVTRIGNYAFEHCHRLTSITIPESVTSIGSSAFYNCSGLTSITIPNSVTSIDSSAFYDCSRLTSITIPNSVTSIGDNAFHDCSGLTSIVVESGNIVYDSRDNCNAIIKTASNTLIAGCMNTIIPESVTSIGGDAFSYCSGLTSVTIPESVTSIGFYAFDSCSSLTSVTIPNSVTSIGNYVFRNCNSLTKVYCLAEIVPNTNKNTFLNFPISSATLYVPASSLEEYETTAPWSEFGTIVGLTEDQIDGIEAIESEETKIGSSYYDLGGHKLDRQQKGVNIIRYSDGTTRKVMVK